MASRRLRRPVAPCASPPASACGSQGRDVVAQLTTPLPADAFEDWVLERELQLAEAEPPVRDEALDDYGEWHEEPNYGRVWMPSYAYGGYDPFRYGHWQQVGFGWSWYDPMPWGAYTYHSGRWAYLDHLNRWCWVPSRRDHGRTSRTTRGRTGSRPTTGRAIRTHATTTTSASRPPRPPRCRCASVPIGRPCSGGPRSLPSRRAARRRRPHLRMRLHRASAAREPQSEPAAAERARRVQRHDDHAAGAGGEREDAAPSTPVNSNKSREFGTIKPP